MGLLFWQVSTLWQREIKKALQPFQLTHTQYVLLAVVEELSEKGRAITQKEISDFSSIDVMTVSSAVRLLEKKWLLCRLPHESDTRAYSIVNTPAGKALLQQAVREVESVDERFFSKDVATAAQLAELLLYLKESNQ